jgi:hypothetical protein
VPLEGFNQAYNRRRQRVLKGRTPDEVVRSRLAAEPKLANRRYKPPDSDALPPSRSSLPQRRSRIQTIRYHNRTLTITIRSKTRLSSLALPWF